jgi:uncharacterized membrane protein YccC
MAPRAMVFARDLPHDAAMLDSLLAMKPRDVPLRVALRNTAAVVLPLGIGIASGHEAAGLGVAAGALNTMFTDQPGPYRLRMQRMLLTGLAAALSAFVGSVLGAHAVLFVLAALLWGVAGGMLVALGPDAGRAGMTSMILLVITGAQPRAPAEALAAGALILAGGALQTLFAVAAWPLQRYRPERQALAQVCRQLGTSARSGADPTQAPPVTQELLDVESLLHGTHRARGDVMDTFRVLAELVERIRLELLVLVDLRAQVPAPAASTLGRVLEYAARVLDALAAALDAGSPAHTASAALEGLDSAAASLVPSAADEDGRAMAIARARTLALAAQLRAAVRNADFAGSRGELRAHAAEARLPRDLRPRSTLAVLRANVGLASVAFRHALRCGVCLALAIAAQRTSGLPHGYWVPMTVAIVLKPDFAGTFRIGLLRVAGTLLGLVLTSALVHYAFGGAWERLALLALLSIGFRMLVTVHYGLGVMMLTGLVVLLLAFEGMAPGGTMLARGIATVAGSAFALAAYALWPTWEHQRMRPALAAMLDAYRGYLAAVLRGDRALHAAARSAARSARTNALASLERLRGEPRPDPRLLALAGGVFATANRLVRACMALEAALLDAPPGLDRDAVGAFGLDVEAVLASLATTLRGGGGMDEEDLRGSERALARRLEDAVGSEGSGATTEALDRITDSVDALRGLVRRGSLPDDPPAAAAMHVR